MRVVCHSQHLTGIGHHVRMHCIASALATGHEVHLVEGGRSVPRPRLAAEPERLVVPVLLRDDSGELVGAGGEPGAAVLAERRRVLADAVAVIRPDVVLIDHYPFSKWELTEEIGALTAAARAANPGTRVVCSLRDLVPQTRYEAVGRSAYDAEVLRRLRDDFDAVLVHAEPTWSGLGDTFPAAGEVEPPVRATGYVVEPALTPRPGELPDEPYAVASAGGLEATEFLGAVVAAHARLVATVPGAPARLHVFARGRRRRRARPPARGGAGARPRGRRGDPSVRRALRGVARRSCALGEPSGLQHLRRVVAESSRDGARARPAALRPAAACGALRACRRGGCRAVVGGDRRRRARGGDGRGTAFVGSRRGGTSAHRRRVRHRRTARPFGARRGTVGPRVARARRMTSMPRSRAFRLDPVHEAVLGVALARDGSAATRWGALRVHTPMADLQQGKVRRLLPLAGAALRGAPDALVSPTDQDVLRAATERAREEHAFRQGWLAGVAGVLHGAGVEIVVLKGAALAETVYPEPELRPMVDVDVLVPTARVRDAIGVLVAAGWTLQGELPQHHVRRGQEVDLRGPAGEKLDLHWHLHPAVVVPGEESTSDEEFFARSLPFPAAGPGARMLEPTDQLFHVLLHGSTNGWPAHPLWVADAAMLVDHVDTFDGDRFTALARDHGMTVPIRASLTALRTRFGRVPRFVDAHGATVDVERALPGALTLRQRRLYAEIGAGRGTKPPDWMPRVLGPFGETYHYWATQSITWPRSRAVREFPGWLADYWHLPGPAAIPRKVVHGIGRRRPGRPRT
ncbi:MAG: nucleotidyltransferase family protein [Acidimicrobiia bacterium]